MPGILSGHTHLLILSLADGRAAATVKMDWFRLDKSLSLCPL